MSSKVLIDRCNKEKDLFLDNDKCPNYWYPCYKKDTRECFDFEGEEKEIKCSKGMKADKYICNNKWPDYPCLDKKTRLCYNKEGDEALIDPIAEVTLATNEFYNKTCDLLHSMLTDKTIRTSPRIKAKTYEKINNYWSFAQDYLKCPERIIEAEYIRPVALKTIGKKVVDTIKTRYNQYKKKKTVKTINEILKNYEEQTKKSKTKSKTKKSKSKTRKSKKTKKTRRTRTKRTKKSRR